MDLGTWCWSDSPESRCRWSSTAVGCVGKGIWRVGYVDALPSVNSTSRSLAGPSLGAPNGEVVGRSALPKASRPRSTVSSQEPGLRWRRRAYCESVDQSHITPIMSNATRAKTTTAWMYNGCCKNCCHNHTTAIATARRTTTPQNMCLSFMLALHLMASSSSIIAPVMYALSQTPNPAAPPRINDGNRSRNPSAPNDASANRTMTEIAMPSPGTARDDFVSLGNEARLPETLDTVSLACAPSFFPELRL